MFALIYPLSFQNFYKPEYQPAGKIGTQNMALPEAELLTSPLTIALLNSFHSLIDLGLTSCAGGLSHDGGLPVRCIPSLFGPAAIRAAGLGPLALPVPEARTATSIVAQLDLLLTGGRLSEQTRVRRTVNPIRFGNSCLLCCVSSHRFEFAWPSEQTFIVDTVQLAHFDDMYIVANSAGVVNPTNDRDNGHSPTCVGALNMHDVVCCSSERGNHGDMQYGVGHRFSSCAEVTIPLFAGNWVAEGFAACDDNHCRNQACVNDLNHGDATEICAADNARLCTQGEIEASCTAYNGCANRNVWTSTPCSVDQSEEAQRLAAKLIIGSAEFRTQSDNRTRANMRPDAPVIISQNRSYRATVMIYADGGMDSANHLIPLDGCAADQPLQGYDHYALNRGPEMALPRNTLLPIAVPEGTQPCTTFGLHPLLAGLKQMYDDGNAMYIANIGNLIEPITKEQFRAKSRRIPSGLFGHNTQISQAQSVEAQNPGAKGVLARIADALTSQPDPYKTGTYSMSGNAPATRGTGV